MDDNPRGALQSSAKMQSESAATRKSALLPVIFNFIQKKLEMIKKKREEKKEK